MDSSKSSERSQIHRVEIEIDWPPGNVAISLLDGSEPVLVDAGMPGEGARESLVAGLGEVGRSIEDIEHLLITHPHVDHLGQIPTLCSQAALTIHAPRGVYSRLSQEPAELAQTVRENGTAAGLTGDLLEGAVEKSLDSLEQNRSLLDPDTVDHWIDHDEQFSIGDWQLRGIHTPGHQADHVSYYSADEQVLFSGDLLLEPFRSVILNAGLDSAVDTGVADYYTALDRLSELTVERIVPGHGPVHTDLAGTVERSRKSVDRLLETTSDRVATGPTTALEIAAERAGKRDIHYVLPEILSVLRHLTTQGEITRSVEDGVTLYQRP